LVVATAFAVLLYFDTPPFDIFRFAIYEAVIVLFGLAVYRASGGGHRPILTQITTGWALGYVGEILLYNAFSWVQLWVGTVIAWGIVVGVIGLIALMAVAQTRRLAPSSPTPTSVTASWHLWAIALLISLALLYAGMVYFAEVPLPGGRNLAGAYFVDVPWQLSMAAEAKYHWPTGDPNIVGEGYNYYWFFYHHLAAASWLSGVPLISLYFRLWFVPLLILLVLQIYMLAVRLSGKPTVGLLAVLLVLFVGELDPFPQQYSVFMFENAFMYFMYASPTLGFSLVMFVPLLLEMWQFTQPEPAALGRRVGALVIIILLLIGCAGVKVTTLSVVLGGLLLLTASTIALYLLQRIFKFAALKFHLPSLLLLLLPALAVQIGAYAFTFSGTSGGLSISPFRSILQMYFVYAYLWQPVLQRFALPDPLKFIYAAILVIPGLIGHMALVMVGVGVEIGFLKETRFLKTQVLAKLWLLAFFATGLIIFLLVNGVNYGQKYFLFAAYVPGCVASAWGLNLLWQRLRVSRPFVRWGVGLPLGALALIGLLDTPLDNVTKWRQLPNAEPVAIAFYHHMTPAIYDGMRWLRDNTPTNAVIALSTTESANVDPVYFFAAGFTERRMFFGGFGNSNQTHHLGFDKVARGEIHPFPERLALNQRVFLQADAQALQRMAREYGVTHLMVVKGHGGRAVDLKAIAQPVFTNAEIEIFAVQ